MDATVIFAPLASDANNRAKATVAAVYVQDQIRPAVWLEIVAGLRFDSFKLEVDDLRPTGGGEFGRSDNLWSPRLGLVLKPTDNLSIYASYSRSYLPQSGDQFSGLTDVTEGLKPERFDNYEIGAKWEPLDGLLATAAIYQLDRTNTRATDPNDPTAHRSHRRAAQPRPRARARAQHHQPLADFGRLCAAEGRDHRDDGRRAGGPRGAAGPAPQLLAVEPLRRDQARSALGPRRDRPVKVLRDDQQCREAARLRPGRCRALLQVATAARGAGQCREFARRRLFPDRQRRQQYRPGRAADGQGNARIPFLARQFFRPRLDPLEVAQEQPLLGRLAVLFGDAEQEARVDRDPAFAAVGERDRRPARRLMVTILPRSERAAVAPSATVTGGLISARSWSIHQRQA